MLIIVNPGHEPHETQPLFRLVMSRGKVVHDPPSLAQTIQYVRERLEMLLMKYKRLENPNIYKVGVSDDLKSLRDRLIAQHKR